YGDHHPSATTWPCRTIMTLWSESIDRSAASTNARTAADETPCASGLLRGRSAPRQAEELTASRTRITTAFIAVPPVDWPSLYPIVQGGTSVFARTSPDERRAVWPTWTSELRNAGR